jgi:hypothetical protein
MLEGIDANYFLFAKWPTAFPELRGGSARLSDMQCLRWGKSDDLLQPWIELKWLRVEKLNMFEIGMSRVKDVDSLLRDDDRVYAEGGGSWKPLHGEIPRLRFGKLCSNM